jgi:hypothetical protein
MGQPFSAKRPRSLPTAAPNQDVNQTLANWQAQLNPSVRGAAPQPTPHNFQVTSGRGGLTLQWGPVDSSSGADGYEILKSANGSFTDDLQIISVKNVNQSSFFDSLGGKATKASYRIRTTSGTPQNPQSQRGPESGVIHHTSIDAADTRSVPSTVLDNYTTDATRAGARNGNYGAINISNVGKTGGAARSVAGVGAGANPNTTAATSFASLTSSTNVGATLIVGAGSKMVPDTTSPGIIQATQLQAIPVSTSSVPSNTNSLQFNSTNGDLEYAATAQTIGATASKWINSYTASSGAFTATQPAASDLSNGVSGTGQVVLSSTLSSYLPLTGGTLSANLKLPTATLTGATPTVLAGQVGLGVTTSTTATTTAGGSALPALAAGYLEVNIGGTMFKIPYYAV